MAKILPINESNGHERLTDWAWFWDEYPRKVAKLDAMKAWQQTEKVRPPIEELVAAIERQCRAWQDKQFIPYPATWLRRGQWADED
jgi:hypothetical protein